MSAVLASEIRLELDYGIKLLNSKVEVSGFTSIALNKLIECRGSIEKYSSSISGVKLYPSHEVINESNNIIEMDNDHVDSFNEGGSNDNVSNIKYVIKGLNMGLEKIVSLRMSRLVTTDAINSYLATRSLDRAVDSLESCIYFLRMELWDISAKNQKLYPSIFEVNSLIEEKVNETKEEVLKTNNIIEERVSSLKEENEKPLSGIDFLPGGRAYVEAENNEQDQDPVFEESNEKEEIHSDSSDTIQKKNLGLEPYSEGGNN